MKRPLDETSLRGLPEMSLFPDDETRRRAVEAMHARATRQPSMWIGAITYALVVWTLVFGLAFVIGQLLPVGRLARWIIAAAIVLAVYCVFLARSPRRDVVHDLRRELVRCGVPVCLGCGYDLRGAADPDAGRCPECGARPGRRVRRLVEK